MILTKRKMIILTVLIVICGIILYALPKFVNTEYYVNREMAYSVVQNLSYEEGLKASAKYVNHFFWIYNSLCHIWGFIFATFIFFLLLKTIKLLHNGKFFDLYKKVFIYVWINLSYFIWATLTVDICINDLGREVLDSCHDSMGIPFIGIWLVVTSLAFIYYPIINLLTFFSYIKKLKQRFINMLFTLTSIIMILFVFIDIYSHFLMQFITKTLFINMIDIVWLMLGFKMFKVYLKVSRSDLPIRQDCRHSNADLPATKNRTTKTQPKSV